MTTAFLTHWNRELERLSPERSDIYFREEYHRLYATGGQEPLCICAQDERGTMLLPFLHRSFAFGGRTFQELETAYGYGGPVSDTDDPAFLSDAARAIRDRLAAEGYLAGFVRLHPILDNWHGMEAIGRVIACQHTVAIDMSGSEEDVWMNEIHRKIRNVIKRAERDGLRFEADYAFDGLEDFIRLYNATMDKLGAEDFYYFPPEYYHRLRDTLPGSFLGLIRAGDQVAAAAIFFRQGPYGHYHLAGSDPAWLAHSPNNLLLWKAALELKSQGVRLFHLGGGTTTDPEDPLFLFKHRFSQSVRTYRIGKFVFDPEAYEAVCADWERNNPEKTEKYGNYLLKYKY